MESNERKKRKMSFTTVGGSSILTIFAVLCFVVFALLSLSTAKANASLTERSTKGLTDYYTADTQAEDILAHLRAGETPADVKIFKAEKSKGGVKRIVADGVGYTDWDAFATYKCAIDDNQEIQVEVLLRYGEGEGEEPGYQIVKWKKVFVGEWKPDDTIPVFDDENSGGLPGVITIDE